MEVEKAEKVPRKQSTNAILMHRNQVPTDRTLDAVTLFSASLGLDSGTDNSSSISPDSNNISDQKEPNAEEFPTVLCGTDLSAFVVENEALSYRTLLRALSCYDAVPSNCKPILLILDTRLPVKKAFFAFISNEARAALVWDSHKSELVGILTISDFIIILLHCVKQKLKATAPWSRRNSVSVESQFESHLISDWRDLLAQTGKKKSFVTTKSDESLFHAIQLLSFNKIHRIPVLDSDTGDPMYLLTYRRLLKVMWIAGKRLPIPLEFSKTPKQLGIGVWGADVHRVFPDTSLLRCLDMLLVYEVSALPVVSRPSSADPGNELLNSYTRFDAIGIATHSRFDDLNITIKESLEERRGTWGLDGVLHCSTEVALGDVVELLVMSEVERMVLVEGERRLGGILTIADIIRHFVLRPSNFDGNSWNIRNISHHQNFHLTEIPELLDVIEKLNLR